MQWDSFMKRLDTSTALVDPLSTVSLYHDTFPQVGSSHYEGLFILLARFQVKPAFYFVSVLLHRSQVNHFLLESIQCPYQLIGNDFRRLDIYSYDSGVLFRNL